MKANLLLPGATTDHIASHVDRREPAWRAMCGRLVRYSVVHRFESSRDRRVCTECIRAVEGAVAQATQAVAEYKARGSQP